MKKMSWGTGIAIVIGIFFVAMAVLVTIAMTHMTDLVADNYYERELAYQDRINSTQRAVNVPDAVRIVTRGDTLNLTLSEQAVASGISGTIHFYRPSNKQMDFDVRMLLDAAHSQRIRTSAMAKGLWKVQVGWKTPAGEFYSEQPLVIN
ncbi:MAG TPA: FixH family protein [Bacteroidota bacterium]|nr:FixH family protein [Bacteroidota bacterium]